MLILLDYFINLILFSGFLDKRNYTCAEEESIFCDKHCYPFRGHNIYCCLQYKQEVNRKESDVKFYYPLGKENYSHIIDPRSRDFLFCKKGYLPGMQCKE